MDKGAVGQIREKGRTKGLGFAREEFFRAFFFVGGPPSVVYASRKGSRWILYLRAPLLCACRVCGKDTRDWKRSDVVKMDGMSIATSKASFGLRCFAERNNA